MALSGIQGTNAQYIILRAAASVNGISVPTGSIASFGSVIAVYTGCQIFGTGDIVMFDSSKAERFFKGGINYSVVDQQYVFFTETPAS